ncbi:MAG: DUF5107 domain-containing protein [Anaerolineae bacterium]|nr:DUF5107 domain-containing protein [Anaerolineae bacterium]
MNSAEEKNRSSPVRKLGAGLRLLATFALLLLLVAISRCAATDLPGTATPTVVAENAFLQVAVTPQGAQVYVDGLRSGTTPVSLELPAGQHTVRVEHEGFEPLLETVELSPGHEVVLDGELTPLSTTRVPTVTSTPAEPPAPTRLPDLVIQSVRIELETGGSCDYESTELGVRLSIQNTGQADAGPFVVEVNDAQQEVPGLPSGQAVSLWSSGYVTGGENTVLVDATMQVDEGDEDNNYFSQMVPIPTLPPTCTPPPAAAATSPPARATATPIPNQGASSNPTPVPSSTPVPDRVVVHEGEVTIPTLSYKPFLQPAWSETFRMPFLVLDRAAYEASDPRPVDVSYHTLTVENEYLRLVFLSELGGRLYEVVYKPTGHRQTYRNPVLKPSPWGPPEQGWWLAAGGFEWCLPVEEHGYEWGIPWQVSTRRDPAGVTVFLRDSDAPDRVRAEIAVRLEAGQASFTIRPRIENPTGSAVAVRYWTNAMLAPGGRNAPSAGLRFVLPKAVTSITVHSRGDDALPGYNERMPWPIVDGIDLSRLGTWNRWLGFFEDPAQGGFMAVYDEGYDEGMVRVFPPDASPGAKVFAFGWQDPISADNWTTDGSGYVEIHGGLGSTFDDSVAIPAGGHRQWTETWYPVGGLGGLSYANGIAALNLSAGDGLAHIAVAVTQPRSGELVLSLDGIDRWHEQVNVQPGKPLRREIPLDDAPQRGRLAVRFVDSDGAVVAEYGADLGLK